MVPDSHRSIIQTGLAQGLMTLLPNPGLLSKCGAILVANHSVTPGRTIKASISNGSSPIALRRFNVATENPLFDVLCCSNMLDTFRHIV